MDLDVGLTTTVDMTSEVFTNMFFHTNFETIAPKDLK